MRTYCHVCDRDTMTMVDFDEGKWCLDCETPLNNRARMVDEFEGRNTTKTDDN